MSSKNNTEVILGGKVFTLSGYESEEYLQKVASYINNKLAEYSKEDSFRRQNAEVRANHNNLSAVFARRINLVCCFLCHRIKF